MPLLEGTAFNELINTSAVDYRTLVTALKTRYGKTTEEVITELLNFRQGHMSVEEYVDKIIDMQA